MLGNLNKQANSNKTHADYLNFVTEAIQRQDTIRSLPLSVEKFERFDELLLKLVLATRLESEFGSDIPVEFTEPLLNIFFRSRPAKSQSSYILNSSNWEMKSQQVSAKNILRLSTELNTIVADIWHQISQNAISFTADYIFKMPMNTSEEGKYIYDFLLTGCSPPLEN